MAINHMNGRKMPTILQNKLADDITEMWTSAYIYNLIMLTLDETYVGCRMKCLTVIDIKH